MNVGYGIVTDILGGIDYDFWRVSGPNKQFALQSDGHGAQICS